MSTLLQNDVVVYYNAYTVLCSFAQNERDGVCLPVGNYACVEWYSVHADKQLVDECCVPIDDFVVVNQHHLQSFFKSK